MSGPGTQVITKVVGLTVEALHPTLKEWEVVTAFTSEEAANQASAWYNKQSLAGWTSAKISKSRP